MLKHSKSSNLKKNDPAISRRCVKCFSCFEKKRQTAKCFIERRGGGEEVFALWQMLLEVPDNAIYCCEDMWVSDTVSVEIKEEGCCLDDLSQQNNIKRNIFAASHQTKFKSKILFLCSQSLDLNVASSFIVIEAEKDNRKICKNKGCFFIQLKWFIIHLFPLSLFFHPSTSLTAATRGGWWQVKFGKILSPLEVSAPNFLKSPSDHLFIQCNSVPGGLLTCF